MRLTIRQIETIPIRVPLPRVYRGSYYQMTHRSTIVTRIHMDEGITGESSPATRTTSILKWSA
jgi:D-galactarolactone cycloisomerase